MCMTIFVFSIKTPHTQLPLFIIVLTSSSHKVVGENLHLDKSFEWLCPRFFAGALAYQHIWRTLNMKVVQQCSYAICHRGKMTSSLLIRWTPVQTHALLCIHLQYTPTDLMDLSCLELKFQTQDVIVSNAQKSLVAFIYA